MADFTKLVGLIRETVLTTMERTKPAGVFFGTVTGADPLRITVDQRLALEAAQLTLARNVTDHVLEMTVEHWSEDETEHTHGYYDSDTGDNAGGSGTRTTSAVSHSHEYKGRKSFLVHGGLTEGERVVLMRMQGGQKYLVWDRVAE